jgi:DNA modification methylase
MSDPYYQDDHVTIYHGDCREVLPDLSGIGSIVTDPPFFMPATHYSSRTVWRRSWGDALVLGQWLADTLGHLRTDPESVAVFCDGASYPVFYASLYTRYQNSSAVVWDKGRIGMGSPWRRSFEMILHMWNGTIAPEDKGQPDVIRVATVPTEKRLHPVDKPDEVLRQIMGVVAQPTGVILDPFAGGGSTLRAAKDLGRKAIGVEIDERYCEIAARRCAQEVLAFGGS